VLGKSQPQKAGAGMGEGQWGDSLAKIERIPEFFDLGLGKISSILIKNGIAKIRQLFQQLLGALGHPVPGQSPGIDDGRHLSHRLIKKFLN